MSTSARKSSCRDQAALTRGIVISGPLPSEKLALFSSLFARLQAFNAAACSPQIWVSSIAAMDAFLVELSPTPSAMLLVELASYCAQLFQCTTWAWVEEPSVAGQYMPPSLLQCTPQEVGRAMWLYQVAQDLGVSPFMMLALPQVPPYELSKLTAAELDGLRQYLARPPLFPRQCAVILWGFLIPGSAALPLVSRAHSLLQAFLNEQGESLTERTLRISTVAGLDAINLELSPTPTDPKQAERPCIDLYETLGTRLAAALGVPVYQLRSGYLYRFRMEQRLVLQCFSPTGGVEQVAQPAEVLATQFRLTTEAQLWELAQTPAFWQPLHTPFLEDECAKYLANPPPQLTAPSAASQTVQPYCLPRWLVMEVGRLSAQKGVPASSVLQQAWELGRESLFHEDGLSSTWPPQPAAPPPLPEPAEAEVVTVLVSSTWAMLDEGLELKSALSQTLLRAYRAARSQLLAEYAEGSADPS